MFVEHPDGSNKFSLPQLVNHIISRTPFAAKWRIQSAESPVCATFPAVVWQLPACPMDESGDTVAGRCAQNLWDLGRLAATSRVKTSATYPSMGCNPGCQVAQSLTYLIWPCHYTIQKVQVFSNLSGWYLSRVPFLADELHHCGSQFR